MRAIIFFGVLLTTGASTLLLADRPGPEYHQVVPCTADMAGPMTTSSAMCLRNPAPIDVQELAAIN